MTKGEVNYNILFWHTPAGLLMQIHWYLCTAAFCLYEYMFSHLDFCTQICKCGNDWQDTWNIIWAFLLILLINNEIWTFLIPSFLSCVLFHGHFLIGLETLIWCYGVIADSLYAEVFPGESSRLFKCDLFLTDHLGLPIHWHRLFRSYYP